jgi:hypothetical protein
MDIIGIAGRQGLLRGEVALLVGDDFVEATVNDLIPAHSQYLNLLVVLYAENAIKSSVSTRRSSFRFSSILR